MINIPINLRAEVRDEVYTNYVLKHGIISKKEKIDLQLINVLVAKSTKKLLLKEKLAYIALNNFFKFSACNFQIFINYFVCSDWIFFLRFQISY